MNSAYSLGLVDRCLNCPIRSEGFFCQVSAASLNAFEAIKHTVAYPEGAVIFVEGQSPQGIYVVCKGRVKLSMTSSEGKTLIVKTVGPGEVMGLNATISNRFYELTAETLYPSQLNFVRREDFLRLLREHAEVSIRVAQQLSLHYRAALNQVRSLGLSHSVPEKLARFLLKWSNEGQATKQGIRVKLALTHEEIGQTIGSSRETVTRTLGEFKSNGLASLHGSTLLIHNKPALESLVSA